MWLNYCCMYGKQCRPWSDAAYLIWVYTVGKGLSVPILRVITVSSVWCIFETFQWIQDMLWCNCCFIYTWKHISVHIATAEHCMAHHCTEPFIITLLSSRSDLNNAGRDVEHQIIIIVIIIIIIWVCIGTASLNSHWGDFSTYSEISKNKQKQKKKNK